MLTFKQFLNEDDPLEELGIEMWFRHFVTPDKELAAQFTDWVMGRIDDLNDEQMDLLYAFYHDEMPYDVAKAQGDLMPDEWARERLERDLEKAGLL